MCDEFFFVLPQDANIPLTKDSYPQLINIKLIKKKRKLCSIIVHTFFPIPTYQITKKKVISTVYIFFFSLIL